MNVNANGSSFFLYCVLCCLFNYSKSQGQKGFITIPETSRNRIKAFLDCGPKLMVMKIYFNNSILREFSDWIVVGLNNRLECRQQGNGELQYLIEIPLNSEPCGTKMVEANNYENLVSIKKHPLLILEGDEVLTARCNYGLQEVQGPLISGSQEFPLPPAPATIPLPAIVSTQSVSPALASGTIYIIVFLLLFLLLLCLLCCCACLIMRRRKKRMEKRKKIFLSVPQSSELNKLGIAHLWWTGKASSNDALLSHDYMISSNSTRDRLSISTEYPNDTTPSGSSSSPNAVAPLNVGPHQQGLYNLDSKQHHSHHMIPRARLDTSALPSKPRDSVDREIYSGSETAGRKSHFKNPSTGKDLRPVQKARHDDEASTTNIETSTVYAHVNSPGQKSSKITNLASCQGNENNLSPKPPTSNLIKADIHKSDDETSCSRVNGGMVRNAVDLDVIIRAIEHNKNLTEPDLKKLYDLVEKDRRIRELLCRAQSYEDFLAISKMAEYERLYNAEKWSQICRSLAEAVLMKRLGETDDADDHGSFSSGTDSDTVKMQHPYEDVHDIHDGRDRVVNNGGGVKCKSKIDTESTSSDNSMAADRSTTEFVESAQQIYQQNHEMNNNNNNFHFLLPASAADLLPRAPVLNVYLGNVPNRSINVQYQSTVNANVNGYYYREVSGNNWDDSSIYGPAVNSSALPADHH